MVLLSFSFIVDVLCVVSKRICTVAVFGGFPVAIIFCVVLGFVFFIVVDVSIVLLVFA